MTRRLMLRRRQAGFSALYGAFGVVLASAVVMGGVLASMSHEAGEAAYEREFAGDFLDALLASNIDNATTLRQAIAESCFSLHCSRGLWNASALRAAIATLAAPLAAALDIAYVVALTAENLTQVRSGPASLADGGLPATVEVFRPRVGDFVGVSLLLAL